MKKMKKLVLVLVSVFTFSLSSYAVETSLGVSLGGGLSFIKYNSLGILNDLGEVQTTFDAIVEFIPYLALETGLGVKYNQGLGVTKFSLPIMLRGQYEYNLGVSYASIGLKPVILNTTGGGPFLLDVGFAVGQEFRLGKANYLGVRIGYDLNVLKIEQNSLFQDDLNFSLTYRYAFNSKWKK